MRIKVNNRKIRIFLIHLLEDRPDDEMLAAEANRHFAVLQHAAHKFANDVEAARRIAEWQQQIAGVEICRYLLGCGPNTGCIPPSPMDTSRIRGGPKREPGRKMTVKSIGMP